MKKLKKRENSKLEKFIFVMFLILSVFISINSVLIYNKDKEKVSFYNNGFYNVQIQGMYKIDDGDWKELNSENYFNLNEYHTYYIKGNFTKDIEKNHEIMIRLKDLDISIKINGEYVFKTNGDKKHTDGNLWAAFLSKGITTEDVVEIELYNIYTGVNVLAINDFLNNIYFGNVDGLYNKVFSENGIHIAIGIVISTLGLTELLAAIIMALLNGKNVKRIVYSGGFTFMAGIWIGIRYNVISLIIAYPILLQCLEVIGLELMCLFLSLYLNTYLEGKLKVAGMINCILIIFWTMFTVSLKLFLNIDMYRTFTITTIIAIINIVVFMMYLSYEYYAKKNKSVVIMIFFVLPMSIGGLFDGIRFWLNIGNGPIALNKGIIISGIIQLVILIYEKSKSDRIVEKAKTLENELIQSRISVMLSQIQPHFLYNSLNTIRYLCTEDPEKAEKAVIDFASFLRGNVDSLSSNGLIPFEKELDHVKHYLSLEKNRFGDRVNVKYDIEITNFMLPPLTLQPIVENAVRYGITKKEEGGTVNINTSETDEDCIITICDDGIGFDVNNMKIKDDKRTHVGIENVRKRLIDQCNGSLEIDSVPNKGTTVVLRIAKGGNNYENNYCR